MREVLLSGYGRVYLSEIVSEFELKTWPRCRDSETRPLSLGEKTHVRFPELIRACCACPVLLRPLRLFHVRRCVEINQ